MGLLKPLQCELLIESADKIK